MKIKEIGKSISDFNSRLYDYILDTDIENIGWTIVGIIFIIYFIKFLSYLEEKKKNLKIFSSKNRDVSYFDQECANHVNAMRKAKNSNDLSELFHSAISKWPHWKKQLLKIYKSRQRKLDQ